MQAKDQILNAVYKDSSMSVYSLMQLQKELKDLDNKIGDTISDIKEGYERYLKETEKLAKKYKVKLKEESMMAKMAAKMGIKEEIKKDNSDARVADMLIKGIVVGSVDIEKKMKNFKSEEKEINELGLKFYEFQQETIEHLKKYL